jgi:hypothetical protein
MAGAAKSGEKSRRSEYKSVRGTLNFMIVVLIVVLCAAFSFQFYLSISELSNLPEPTGGFAADAPQQYPVGLFHFLSFILLGLSFARKYFWAFGLAVTYFLLNIFATYSRLGTGFLGGDMCPEGHPCLQAMRRATWFDLTAAILLLLVVILISIALYSSKQVRGATQ